MEDILEELVGEIWDEHDRVVEEFQILSRGCYRVSGSMNIYDMLEELELDERLYDGDSTTAAGWATERLGELPEAGDSFEFEGFTVTIEQTEDLRIASLILRLNQA
jgi:CBS domain containing-hemolysin-like protein